MLDNLSCLGTRFRLLCHLIVYCSAALTSLSDSVKPDFHSHTFRWWPATFFVGDMRRAVKGTDQNEKYLCSHLKFKYFNFSEIFLQRNQTSFLNHVDISLRSKNSQNGRPAAFFRPERKSTSVYSQNKNYRASDWFSLATVFCWNCKKVEINSPSEIFVSDEK